MLRLEIPGADYHITVRRDCREAIFRDDEDRLLFIDFPGKEVTQQVRLLYALRLMDKHYHLLVAAGASFILMSPPVTICAAPQERQPRYAVPVEAQFRGCESAGWCRFWIESLDPFAQSGHRVYPDGVPPTSGDKTISVAVRDRLNALLASMVHQHKRIVLHDLREVEDGVFAATVMVNEVSLASDRILLELLGNFMGTTPQGPTR